MADTRDVIVKLKSAAVLKKTMNDYFQRVYEAEKSPDKKVAWCTSVGPAELLYSMGFEVFFPENHGAMIGTTKQADKYIPAAVSRGYSPDICSYLTSDIGAFLMNETPLQKMGYSSVPRPDILVFNTNQCREVEDWFSFYGRHFKVPVLGIHTPLGVGELSDDIIQSVSRQMENLVPELEKIAPLKFDMDRFKYHTRLSRDACIKWREVLETAKHIPSPINFFDSAIHMGPIVVMRGTTYALEYYEVLLAELEERIANGISAVPNEKIRLYWEGMPLWYRLSSLARLFGSLNAAIVVSTYCNSWVFDDLDPDHPFDSAALAYTKLFIVRSEEYKEKELLRLMDEFSVHGIIYHDSKTCPRNSNNRFGMPLRLYEKNHIPYLEINGDLNDPRCFSEEQAVIAIETFIEQLKENQTVIK